MLDFCPWQSTAKADGCGISQRSNVIRRGFTGITLPLAPMFHSGLDYPKKKCLDLLVCGAYYVLHSNSLKGVFHEA